jgi:hypothetical protein
MQLFRSESRTEPISLSPLLPADVPPKKEKPIRVAASTSRSSATAPRPASVSASSRDPSRGSSVGSTSTASRGSTTTSRPPVSATPKIITLSGPPPSMRAGKQPARELQQRGAAPHSLSSARPRTSRGAPSRCPLLTFASVGRARACCCQDEKDRQGYWRKQGQYPVTNIQDATSQSSRPTSAIARWGAETSAPARQTSPPSHCNSIIDRRAVSGEDDCD